MQPLIIETVYGLEKPIRNVLRDVTQIDKSAFRVSRAPGVATQAKNNADRVVTPLCRGKKDAFQVVRI